MKLHVVLLIVWVTASLAADVSLPAMQLVDEILAIIYHAEGTVAVLKSDIRPGVDGRPQTLREVIFSKLMQLDALYHKITVTTKDAEKYIENIQNQHHLSRSAVEKLFQDVGYTYAEALEYLRGRQMVEQVVEYRVRSHPRMIISRAQARERYDQHPPKIEARYTLAIAFVPQELLGKQDIHAYLDSTDIDKAISFDDPIELSESDIADDRKSIIACKEGDIVFVEAVDGGHEITRLIKKVPEQIKPFDEAYQAILASMRQERLQEVFADYYALLLSQATIKFTHPEDAKVLESTQVMV